MVGTCQDFATRSLYSVALFRLEKERDIERNEGDCGGIRGGTEGDSAAVATAGAAREAQGLRPGGRIRPLGRALTGGPRPPRQGHRGRTTLSSSFPRSSVFHLFQLDLVPSLLHCTV